MNQAASQSMTDALTLPVSDPGFQALDTRKQDLLAAATRAVIDSDTAAEQAADLTKLIKTAYKKAEDMRLALVKPIKDHATNIDKMFKPIKDELDRAEAIIKGKVGEYLRAKRAEAERVAAAERRRQEEEALAKAAQAEQSGHTAMADAIIEQAVSTPAPAAPVAAPVRGDFGGTLSTRKVRTFRLADLSKVPSEYLLLNETAVRAAIREAERAAKESGQPFNLSIAGLEIVEDETVVSR